MHLPRCTLAYGAPEVAIACLSDAPVATEVSPAVDVWSLAALTYECLTDSKVFATLDSRETVLLCARGDAPYPWERPEREQHAAWLESSVRGWLLECLQRAPERRPSAAELQRKLNVLGNVARAS